jgi:hypothetical protein
MYVYTLYVYTYIYVYIYVFVYIHICIHIFICIIYIYISWLEPGAQRLLKRRDASRQSFCLARTPCFIYLYICSIIYTYIYIYIPYEILTIRSAENCSQRWRCQQQHGGGGGETAVQSCRAGCRAGRLRRQAAPPGRCGRKSRVLGLLAGVAARRAAEIEAGRQGERGREKEEGGRGVREAG